MAEERVDFDHRPQAEQKIVVTLADGKERQIQFMASTTYWFEGRPVSSQEFLERLFGDLHDLVATEAALRTAWGDPETRRRLISGLADRGYDWDRLEKMRTLIDAQESDVFDVLAYVRFTLIPKTRRERADHARQHGLDGYTAEMREFLRDVLAAYERHGVTELGYDKLSDFLKSKYGTTSDASRTLGDAASVRAGFAAIQSVMFEH